MISIAFHTRKNHSSSPLCLLNAFSLPFTPPTSFLPFPSLPKENEWIPINLSNPRGNRSSSKSTQSTEWSLQSLLPNAIHSQESMSPIPSKPIVFSSSNHSNPIHSIHFLISSFLNTHQIPRQFHVSTFQACNSLQSCYSYRFPIGSWNDYSMEYFRILPNSSAYVTDSCPSDSFSRRTVCLV